MNKLMVAIIALFTISPVLGMELMTITEKEKEAFSQHLAMAVGFGKRMVAEKKITENDPMHVMLIKLSDDLTTSDGDLSKMIKFQGLEDRIERFNEAIDSEYPVKYAKRQISLGAGDCKKAEEFLIRARHVNAELILGRLHATYSPAWIGEVQKEDRIKFMARNQFYPLKEEAKKDYIAFFIYQLVFASRIPSNRLEGISRDMLKEQETV